MLFKTPKSNATLQLIIVISSAILLAIVGFFIGHFKYDNSKVLNELQVYRDMLEGEGDTDTINAQVEKPINVGALARVQDSILNMVQNKARKDSDLDKYDLDAMHLIGNMQEQRRSTRAASVRQPRKNNDELVFKFANFLKDII